MSFARLIKAFTAVRVCAAAVLWAGPIGPAAAGPGGAELLRTHCSGCHRENAGQFEHISGIRQSPEGWLMTLERMHELHGLAVSEKARDALVHYLSDTQGLAPGETFVGRFALERRPNIPDLDLGADINATCGRCHSLAMISLQHRDEGEWGQLARLHVGAYASLTHQAAALDATWLRTATGAVAAQLAARYPFQTVSWTQWKDRPTAELSGLWAVVGHVPGGHDFQGTASIERDEAGTYRARYQLTDTAGAALRGESKAMVYTGYEWRGSAKIGGRALREIYTVGPSGNQIAGRWFDPDHAEDGGEWLAFRDNGKARMFAMLPHALRTGTTTEVVIVGTGLEKQPGSLSLGDGTVVTNEQRDSHSIRARVSIADDAQPGSRNASVGSVGALGLLAIYRQIDQIEVVPKSATARLGEGKVAPVTAQFEAIGSTRLPSGALLPLGPVTADWSASIDAAKRAENDHVAGQMDQLGRFLPARSGSNPERALSGENVDLSVTARSRDTDHAEGRAHLTVTGPKESAPSTY
jgi:quinohemoprotein amine dehydrogenase